MSNDLDAMLGADFDIRQQALSADVPLRATRNGYELDMPVEDIAEEMPPMDVEPTAQPEQESADPFEVLSRVGTTVYDLPNMAIRGILRAGGEAAYSAGFIDETQANTWRKMLDLSGKMAEGEGVFPIARGLGEGLAQFGAGMYGPFKAMRAMGVSRPAAALISEGLSGAFVFNPDDPNVGNFINSFEGRPEWLKAIGDFIETDPNDTEAENRFRNMLQDVVPSAFIEGLVKVVSKVRNMDADTLIEAGAEAEERIASQMQGATLSANPVGAAGDAMVAGAGKVARAMKPTEINEADRVVADDLINRPELWGEDVPNINERREMVDAMLRGERFEGEEGVARLFNDHAERLSIEQAEPAPVFYSAVANAVDALPMDKGNASQMRAMIAKSAEVKPEEMAWIGLDDFLKGKKSVTKQEIKDFVDANQVRIEEVVKDLDDNLAGDERLDLLDMVRDGEISQAEYNQRISDLDRGLTKFSDYTLPGGENYREVLLRLPDKGAERLEQIDNRLSTIKTTIENAGDMSRYDNFKPEAKAKVYEQRDKLLEEQANLLSEKEALNANPLFRGGHYDEPNVLAHMRLNDRTGPNGEKILFVEEIQSDWHQKGRKRGYRDEKAVNEFEQYSRELAAKYNLNPNHNLAMHRTLSGMDDAEVARYEELQHRVYSGTGIPSVPDAPLKKTWHEMSFRRIARMAAEEGYDAVAWTPGKLQAERYDLSKQVGLASLAKEADGKYTLYLEDVKGERIRRLGDGQNWSNEYGQQSVTPDELVNLVGKDLADKLLSGADEIANAPSASKNSRFFDLRGTDLQVGGEGMKGFYDKMLKGYAAKWGKKFGAKVGVTKIQTGENTYNVFDESGVLDSNVTEGRVDEVIAEYNRIGGTNVGKVVQNDRSTQVWTLPVTKKMRDSVLGKGVATFGAAGVAAGLNQQEARPNGN